MCSGVIYRPPPDEDRPIVEAPYWHFAKMASARLHASVYIWSGCRHAAPFGGGAPVEESLRSLVEAKWAVEAQRLFEEKTRTWTPEQRERFGKPLGFGQPVHE